MSETVRGMNIYKTIRILANAGAKRINVRIKIKTLSGFFYTFGDEEFIRNDEESNLDYYDRIAIDLAYQLKSIGQSFTMSEIFNNRLNATVMFHLKDEEIDVRANDIFRVWAEFLSSDIRIDNLNIAE